MADEPLRLPSYLTDRAQALNAVQTAELQQAIDSLYSKDHERLWIVYVRNFQGLDSHSWGEQTARLSGFADRDVLLSIAVDDRAYAFTGTVPSSVSDKELDRLLTDKVEPKLRNGDWAGAGLATANGLSEAMGASGGLSGRTLLLLLLIVAFAALAVWLFLRVRRRRRDRAALQTARRVDPTDTAALAALPLHALDTRSKETLVDTDNAIRTSAEELRLATDEFGALATTPFTAALEGAKTALAKAFSIRQQLDDDIPETPDEQRRLLVELIGTCGRADRELDAKVTEFDGMRNLLINAGDRLDALTRDLVALTTQLPGSQATLSRLTAEHPASVLAPIRDNVSMAQERISFAERTIESGRAAVAKPVGEQGAAVADIRSAESAVDAARTLLTAIDTAATDIEQARAGLPAIIAELQRDLDIAATLTEHGGSELPTATTAARAALDQATTEAHAAIHWVCSGRPSPPTPPWTRPSRRPPTVSAPPMNSTAASSRPSGPPSRRSPPPPISSAPAAAASTPNPAPAWPKPSAASNRPSSSPVRTRHRPSNMPSAQSNSAPAPCKQRRPPCANGSPSSSANSAPTPPPARSSAASSSTACCAA